MITSSFTGRVAVVTGGANGIGRATVELLARLGARVAVLDKEVDTLAKMAAELQAEGGAVFAFPTDLLLQDEIAKAFARVREALGPVDILVNNVGQTARGEATEFWRSKPETWEFVIGISLMTTLRCTREVVGGMRDRRAGKIVNVTSDAALIGDAGIADYVAAKNGVIGFTRSLARELARFTVNVNAVAPGATLTRGPRQLPPETLEQAVARIPMGEMCDPADIAHAIAFLASNEARMITGQVLAVNGGRVLH